MAISNDKLAWEDLGDGITLGHNIDEMRKGVNTVIDEFKNGTVIKDSLALNNNSDLAAVITPSVSGLGWSVKYNLKDGVVTTAKLANLGVTADKIAIGAVITDKISANAVTTEKIVNGAITVVKLAANAAADNVNNGSTKINGEKIVDNSIGSGQLISGAAALNVNGSATKILAEKIDNGITSTQLATNAAAENVNTGNTKILGEKIANKTIGSTQLAISGTAPFYVPRAMVQFAGIWSGVSAGTYTSKTTRNVTDLSGITPDSGNKIFTFVVTLADINGLTNNVSDLFVHGLFQIDSNGGDLNTSMCYVKSIDVANKKVTIETYNSQGMSSAGAWKIFGSIVLYW